MTGVAIGNGNDNENDDGNGNIAANNNGNLNGNGGQGDGQFMIVGAYGACVSISDTAFTILFIYLLEFLLGILLHFALSRFIFPEASEWTTYMKAGGPVFVFVAPILQMVHNTFGDPENQSRFEIRVMSRGALLGSHTKEAILDSGASANITNSLNYICDASVDNSYSLVGVNGHGSTISLAHIRGFGTCFCAGKPLMENRLSFSSASTTTTKPLVTTHTTCPALH